MKKLSSSEIRSSFLEFFRKNQHKIIEGSSVIPKDDPSLLFINAGMAPLKPYFLGHKKPDNPRMANVQPCIRTRDIADVGDRHHLTMFEMLGSWSIGDYFKTKAVELAYELLVDVLGFDSKSLYATCYAGSSALNLPPDEESYQSWIRCGIPSERIAMLNEDNFWSAGDTGPCGPCTEVFFDCGDQYGPAYKPGGHFDSVKRYIEIWNAGVFMEFNKKSDGTFEPLPFKSVDTGSGLERMTMVMNGHDSVYETDLFAPLMNLARAAFPGLLVNDYRIISDHVRASVFILSGGVTPSNEGQGYIPRRLLRRSMSSIYRSNGAYLNLMELAEIVINSLGSAYPELKRTKDQILGSMAREISEFSPVITSGVKMFEAKVKDLRGSKISGTVAFDLVATYGLPLDVIVSLSKAHDLEVDVDAFEEEFKKHQDTSRVLASAQKLHGAKEQVLASALVKIPATKFIGYHQLDGVSPLLLIVGQNGPKDRLVSGEEGYVVFAQTPFYAESGGQICDQGSISTQSGLASVIDCQKHGDIFVHYVKMESGSMVLGDSCQLNVSPKVRDEIKNHHSATHLLHSALRLHLGNTVVQKGSLVESTRLRFDFQHHAALTSHEIQAVETTVNQWIWQRLKNNTEEMPVQKAMESGAMALFGENYGNSVRVVSLGEASKELCGGIHVDNTGDIGLFVIKSETSIAKGVRRIEAVVGFLALQFLRQQQNLLKDMTTSLGVRQELALEAIDKLKTQIKEARKSKSSSVETGSLKLGSLLKGSAKDGTFLLTTSNLAREELTTAVYSALEKEGCQIGVVLANLKKKILYVFITKELALRLDAKDLLNYLLAPFGGKGGGKPNFAQGGFDADLNETELLGQIQYSLSRYKS